jgi:hypothetical protein
MKAQSIVTIILSGCALAACDNAADMPASAPAPVAGPVEQAPPMPAAPPAAMGAQTTTQASLVNEPEWSVLFAGHDLTSFDMLGDAQWNIVDDYVEADGYLNSYLVTRMRLTDFRLRLEFWPGAGANSGIFIRCDDSSAVAASSCYEINIFDTNENPDNRTGSIVAHVPPMVTSATEEQWNTYDIVAEGSSIVVTLNGTVTARLDDNSHPNGAVALQNNGGLIRFRNIELQPL